MIAKLSIIIPVLNSASTLPACIAALLPFKDRLQIIAVDGGSIDGTELILKEYPDIQIIRCSPGRARQMNAGAARATEKGLLFLHSDTILEYNWLPVVIEALDDMEMALGTFKFAINKKGLSYRLITWGTRFRNAAFQLPYGDQAFFMRTSMFTKLGGFKEQRLMEDVELVQRATKQGKIHTLSLRAFTSASAWEADSPWKRTLKNWLIYQRYRMRQSSADELAAAYYKTPTAIGVFCKNPIPGKVKTRLGKTIGHDQAVEIYNLLVGHTQNILSQLKGRTSIYFFFDPPGERESIQHWLGMHCKLVPQARGNLGDRMLSAFIYAQERDHDHCILIGTDCPDLNAGILEMACAKIKKHDVVLGPANDGGYYLIAAKQSHPSLFEDIEWSTDSVLSETIERIKAAGLTYSLLPALDDLDTEDDLQRHQATIDTYR